VKRMHWIRQVRDGGLKCRNHRRDHIRRKSRISEILNGRVCTTAPTSQLTPANGGSSL
jgi:hypothetical protein